MTQTLVVVVLFVGAMAVLPWLVRRVQQRHVAGAAAAGTASRVVSAVAVGPQQRVVTVEVGPEHARTWLVLGVTAQQVSCLHVLPVQPLPLPGGAGSGAPGMPSFAQEMAAAAGEPGKAAHG
ncbi:flagellar biosynthetic protein FliO [Acidovorax sp. FJL06]|uniref:FliO/MopB family protein n=1 Tax=Acidovorax sp. FJL06 TaxID=2153365 RepID=UPI000F5768E0|nr:flagellar biosynthetic protein FliO [Acidovorax sp. FJL06]RQO80461.1 flagellar biosynthesis protein FliO [Acidovorax sp. FJL06]